MGAKSAAPIDGSVAPASAKTKNQSVTIESMMRGVTVKGASANVMVGQAGLHAAGA